MKIRKLMTAIASMAMAGVMMVGCSSGNSSTADSGSSSSASGNSSSSAADNGGASSIGNGEAVNLTVWGFSGRSGNAEEDVR